eukprot:scaffold792_cov60-Phaeocystis_antarctica.AAC.3
MRCGWACRAMHWMSCGWECGTMHWWLGTRLSISVRLRATSVRHGEQGIAQAGGVARQVQEG